MTYIHGILAIIFGLFLIARRARLETNTIHHRWLNHCDARRQCAAPSEAMSLLLILLLFWAQMMQRSDPGPYARCFVSEKRVYCQGIDGNLTAGEK